MLYPCNGTTHVLRSALEDALRAIQSVALYFKQGSNLLNGCEYSERDWNSCELSYRLSNDTKHFLLWRKIDTEKVFPDEKNTLLQYFTLTLLSYLVSCWAYIGHLWKATIKTLLGIDFSVAAVLFEYIGLFRLMEGRKQENNPRISFLGALLKCYLLRASIIDHHSHTPNPVCV